MMSHAVEGVPFGDPGRFRDHGGRSGDRVPCRTGQAPTPSVEGRGTVSEERSPRRDFRVLTRRRTGYDGGLIVDIQLQVAATGALVWSRSFSDERQANELEVELEDDLDTLDLAEFRRKHGIPSSA